MHLIVLERELTSQRGGQELNLFELCQGLAQRGHAITLLYEKSGNLLHHYAQFCDRIIPISAYGFDRRHLGNTLQFFSSLVQLLGVPVTPESVILINDYHFSLFGYALSWLRNLPYVCYLQIPPCDFNRQRRFGLKRVNHFIAVSHKMKQAWSEVGYGADPISVVHNGVDLTRFYPAQNQLLHQQQYQCQYKIPDRHQIISYIGRIDTEKGLETLIQAIAILADRSILVHLLLAGKPVVHYSAIKGRECETAGWEYQQSLQQLAQQLKIDSQVQFLGHLDNPVPLYQASDVTVLPSRWNEPFGRSIIESLACGTPVVASRIGGIPEILREDWTACLFDPEDAEDLADRLRDILNWRDRDPHLGQRGRDYVLQHFSDRQMIDGVEKILLAQVPHRS